MSQVELLLQTQILSVESPSEKKTVIKERGGGNGGWGMKHFKTALEEKAEVASLFFGQVCELVESGVQPY